MANLRRERHAINAACRHNLTKSASSSSMKALGIIVFLLFMFIGCESQKESKTDVRSSVPTPLAAVLSHPQPVTIVELPHEAIPTWREHRQLKPALVLFSSDPFLQTIPANLRAEVLKATVNDSTETLCQNGPFSSSPILLPGQTLSAALAADFFSRVIWVAPHTSSETFIDLESTREKLFEIGAIDDYELQSLEASPGGFSGTIKNTPFTATTPYYLPKIDGPAIFHFDLTYFRDLYKNEIATPLYQLLADNAALIQQTATPAASVTLSLNTQTEAVSLDARFLGKAIADIFAKPEIIGSTMPDNWQLHRDVLYLNAFFQPEKMLNLYQRMRKNDPKDPAIDFGLYETYLMLKDGDKALEELNAAVSKDHGYADEYLNLSLTAEEKGLKFKAIELLEMASAVYPQNIEIKFRLIDLYKSSHKVQQVLELIHQLQKMPWSETYYPTIPDKLKELAAELSAQTSLEN